MNNIQVTHNVVIPIPVDRAPELVAATVNSLGWKIRHVDSLLKRLSAMDNKIDVIGRDSWKFEFDLAVSWKKVKAESVDIAVSVSERQMQWTLPHCEERCRAIVEGIKLDAKAISLSEQVSDTYGSAKWDSVDDLDRAGYVVSKTDHTRLILGPARDGFVISVPPGETAMHATVCGPTGSGKSSTVYIPNLIERTGISAVVTEATAGTEEPDLFKKTSGLRKTAGHKIYYFNPDDLRSTRINPIEHLKTYDEASHVASLIIQNTSGKHTGTDKIWEDSERQLLKSLILHAMGEKGTLADIRSWLREGPEKIGALLKNSTYTLAMKEFWGFFNNSSEGFRFGVISGLMQRLNLWVSPRIAALTEKTDLDIDALPNELFTFYFAVPAQKTELKPLSALIFNFILDLALQRKFQRPLALFLDEFTNYGYIPGIAEKMTIIRHRNIPAMLGFQDYVQLRKVYGDDDATLLFSQPGTRFVFRPRDNTTARKVSDALGSKTIIERKVTSSGHINEREFARKLMSPDEVMSLEKGKAIVFTPSTNPILLQSFTWQDYKEAIAFDPPDLRTLDVDEELKRRCEQEASKPEWQHQAQEKKYNQNDNTFKSQKRREKRKQKNAYYQSQQPSFENRKTEPKVPEQKLGDTQASKQNQSGSPSRFNIPEGI
ncbi:MAG: type IV secretory system conjugative DNA transfer family protein [Cyanobacteria bacterium TGS_CYA1]|nr:type IV secretory system conjugative DNA transfer family protein [Cyanobacteria bacterium TGS_CYA1]